jgi:hypothetical protein
VTSRNRRQLLQAGAAATLLALVRRPVAARVPDADALKFFFDPRHGESQRLAGLVQAARGTIVALDSDDGPQGCALSAGIRVLAGRTTCADFTWLSDLARARGLRPYFHAYHTVSPGPAAAGAVERRILVAEGIRTPRLAQVNLAQCDTWLQALLPPRVWPTRQQQLGLACGRGGCTLHDWVFVRGVSPRGVLIS